MTGGRINTISKVQIFENVLTDKRYNSKVGYVPFLLSPATFHFLYANCHSPDVTSFLKDSPVCRRHVFEGSDFLPVLSFNSWHFVSAMSLRSAERSCDATEVCLFGEIFNASLRFVSLWTS